MDWRATIKQTVDAHGGLVTRQQLLQQVPVVVLDGHVGRRNLTRVFPHVYRLGAGRTDDEVTLLRAALLHAGPGSALSHTTELSVWGLGELRRPLHLTVDHAAKRSGTLDLVVHRRLRFDPSSEQCTTRAGLRITDLPRTLIDTWPLLPVQDRRPLVIRAARENRVTVPQLRAALAERPNVAGHRALRQTIELIADGCQSELEAHGILEVFRHRSLPKSVGQHHVDLPTGRIRLDRAFPEVKLALELDGAQFHTSPEDRARDLARDRALAALGWVVLRFTYADVVRDPDAVRAKILEVYRARAEQRHAS